MHEAGEYSRSIVADLRQRDRRVKVVQVPISSSAYLPDKSISISTLGTSHNKLPQDVMECWIVGIPGKASITTYAADPTAILQQETSIRRSISNRTGLRRRNNTCGGDDASRRVSGIDVVTRGTADGGHWSFGIADAD
jgi:hypothetical protein